MVNDNSFPESRALEAALRFLNFKPRTQGELDQKLTKLGFSQEVRKNTCAYLASLGLINDQRYAEEWILERSEKKKSSRKKILYELVSKGISREIAEERLNELYPPDLEVEKAAWVAQKFMRNNQDLSQEEMETKIKSLLFRKGFGADTIKKVCRQLFQQGL
jgi:regulatory protein